MDDDDINIGVTESGRTIILESDNTNNHNQSDDNDGLGDMEFGGGSHRTNGSSTMVIGNTERSILNSLDVGTTSTANNNDQRDKKKAATTATSTSTGVDGLALMAASASGGTSGVHDDNDGVHHFTSTERTVDTIATIDTVGTIESTRLEEIKSRAFAGGSSDGVHGKKHNGEDGLDEHDDDDDDDDEGARICAPASAIRFQPLQPIIPQKPPPQIQRIQEAALMVQRQQEQQPSLQIQSQQAVGLAKPPPQSALSQQLQSATTSVIPASNSTQPVAMRKARTESTDSSGFLDLNNFNPAVASASASAAGGIPSSGRRRSQRQMQRQEKQKATADAHEQQQQMSHTPPSSVATSYETSHFGKRSRTGSLSDRVLAASELEGKGVINRDQKGILKDLIISGQDNDLQKALDRYDQGDASMLEGMLQSGTLPNAAAQEVDLLGNLDFDFLNVKNGTTQSLQDQASITSDGIGDMSFDGGQSGWGGYSDGGLRSRSNSTWSEALELMQKHQQQRSRSNTTASMDLVHGRDRSNSLFSSLIGAQNPNDVNQTNYGRWMDPQQFAAQQQLLLQQQMMQQHAQVQQQQQLEREAQMGKYDDDDDENDDDDDAEDEEMDQEENSDDDDLNERLRQAISGAEKKLTKAQKAQQLKKKKRELAKKKKEREKLRKKKEKEKAKALREKEKEKKKKKKEAEQQQQQMEAEEVVHVPGRPHSPSDPNFFTNTIDEMGLRHVVRPEGWTGAYSPNSRKIRIAKFLEKRNHRVWTKAIKYDVRKNFANTRLRVKGRFVKKEDELLMRELMGIS